MSKFFKLSLVLLILGLSSSLYSQAPNLASPDSSGTCVERAQSFRWSFVPNAIGYHLQVTESSGDWGNSIINDSTIQGTSVFYELPDNEMTYYWRVGSRYSSSTSFSSEWEFTTNKAPSIGNFPIDQSTCVDQNVIFDWVEVQDADNYELQVSTNLNFTDFEINQSNISSNTFQTDLDDSFTTYYWRVRAHYVNNTEPCTSEWSAPLQFRTRIGPPQLTAPIDSAQGIDFAMTLAWNQVDGATNYELQLSKGDTFETFVVNDQNVSGINYPVQLEEINNQEYFWRMRSVESSTCYSDWSDVRTFRTPYQETFGTSPTNFATCQTLDQLELTWTQVSGASAYRIRIGDQEGFTQALFDIDSIETTSISLDMPADLTTYYWIVRAEDENNFGIWSDTLQYTTGIFLPTLLEPLNGSSDVFIEPTLEWTSESNFSNYAIQISTDDSYVSDSIVYENNDINDESITELMPYFGTTYFWRTSSTFGECVSGWSRSSSFTTMQGYPELTSPDNSANNQALNLELTWTEVPGAISYDIELSYNPSFDVLEYGKVGVTGTNISVTLKPERTYYWRVSSNFNYIQQNGDFLSSPWSSIFSFSTTVAPAGVPQLVSPANTLSKVATDVQLVWESQESADFYSLEIATDNDFDDIYLAVDSIPDTTYTTSGLDNYTKYYWRIKSLNAGGETPWSSEWNFRTIAPEVTSAPVLDSPGNNETELDTRRVFLRWISMDEAENNGGGYRLQFATSEEFEGQDLLIDQTNIDDPVREVNLLNDTTTYWWRVLAWNETGEGPWSEIWNFTTADVTSIRSPEFIENIDLYPNPTKGRFSVRMNITKASEATFILVDVQGNQIFSRTEYLTNIGISDIEFDSIEIPSGQYYLIVRSGNGMSSHKLQVIK